AQRRVSFVASRRIHSDARRLMTLRAERSAPHPDHSPRRIRYQNTSLSPSWICRDVVTVEVMRPQVGATIGEPSAFTPVKAVRPEGTAKLGWLGTLKHSARNRSVRPRPSSKPLTRDRSTDTRPGPMSVSRPRFPRVLAGWSWKQPTSQ